MTEPEFNADGYPTERMLRAIRKWPHRDTRGLMKFLELAWKYPEYFRIIRRSRRVYASTGGWSGNEELIRALQKNFNFWMLCWVSSTRGGHYVFEIPKTLWVDSKP